MGLVPVVLVVLVVVPVVLVVEVVLVVVPVVEVVLVVGACRRRRTGGSGGRSCARSSGCPGRCGCPGRGSGTGGASGCGRRRGAGGTGRCTGAVVIFLAFGHKKSPASGDAKEDCRYTNGDDFVAHATKYRLQLHRGKVHVSPCACRGRRPAALCLQHWLLHGTVLHIQHRANGMDNGCDTDRGNHGFFRDSLLPQHVLMRVNTLAATVYRGGSQTP